MVNTELIRIPHRSLRVFPALMTSLPSPSASPHDPLRHLMEDTQARFVVDEQGRICFSNRAFAALFGADTDHLTGQKCKNVLRFCDPAAAQDDRSLFLYARGDADAWARSINDGSHDVVINHRRHRFHFTWLRLPDDRTYLVAAEQDGIDPMPWERDGPLWRSLAETLAPDRISKGGASPAMGHFDGFGDLVPDALAVCGRDGVITQANPVFLSWVRNDAGVGSSLFDGVGETDRAAFRSLWAQLLDDGASPEGRCDDPSPVIDCETSFQRNDDQCGTPPRIVAWRLQRRGARVLVMGRDITAIKAHETALARQQRLLREAQSIARTGHWSWPVGSDQLEWSDELYRIFGVHTDEFTPTLESLRAMIHRRDIGRINQAFERALIERSEYELDFRIKRPDGTVRFLRCEGRCERNEDGDVTALFGIMQDITERVAHERELRSAKDEAERAYAAKTQFLANMSHELRTPLNAIIGFSEMMQRQLLGPLGNDRYLDYIEGIRQSGEHLLDLISDILDMSKIEAGKYELEIERLDLGKLMHLAVHMVESKALESGVNLVIDPIDDAASIRADRRAVLQIVLNLLSNAIKFTDAGGSVTLSCTATGQGMDIRVRDTGIGIPAHMIDAVLRPFEQVASHYSRDHKGSGLGLAICKELAELHGGRLSIQSRVGVGTHVTIHLPSSAAPSSVAERPAAHITASV